MSWKEITLGEAVHVKHGFAFKGEHFVDEGDLVVLTPGNFNEEGGFRTRSGKDRFYVGDVPDSYVLNESDLIIAMTEQGPGLLGSSAFIPESNRYLHNQRIGLVDRIDDQLLDREYLYYLFNTRGVRGQINGSASGTKVRHTAPERIYRVRVRIPADVIEQKGIAQTLKAHDDLIANNWRRIELLEQTARLLFNEWFVRLRFPGYEHEKVVDGVPTKWKRQPLGEVCDDVRLQVDPKQVEADVPYIGLEHIPRRSVTICEWGAASDATSSKFAFSSGDVLFGKIRPYLHKVGLAFNDGITSSDAIVIRPVAEKYRDFSVFLLSSDSFVALASKTVREGSKMPRADWKFLKRQVFAIPDDALLAMFSDVISPVVRQLRTLMFQARKLRQARDLLLPRLMDGRLSV